jgi:hypothetical protein
MKHQRHVVNRLAEYLAGNLSQNEKAGIDRHLKSCRTCRAEFASLSTLWGDLGHLPEEEPSGALSDRFYATLAREQGRVAKGTAPKHWSERLAALLEHLWPRQPAFQFGIAVVFLLVGYVIGFRVDGAGRTGADVEELRAQLHSTQRLVVLSLLKVESASERLMGVNWSERIGRPDGEILSALYQTLDFDPNVNVRLAAMDALSRFSDQPEVKQALLQSFPRQTSPLLQLALIDVVVQAKIRDAVPAFNRMLSDPSVNQTVKEHIRKRLQELQQGV